MAKKDTAQTIRVDPIKEILKFFRGIEPTKFLIIVLVVLAVGGMYGSYYFYGKYSAIIENPNIEVQKETTALVSALGKLMELPTDEIPTIATIADKEKLKDQPFFKMAENGDKLFAYNTRMMAILYRPRTNKIINMAPISINQPQNSILPSSAPSTSPPLRVAYFNGTETVGLAGLAEKAVQEKYPNYQTSALVNASRKDYKETLIVDLSGKHNKEASDLARFLNGKTGDLPQGETAPDADILVIYGI